MKMRHHVKISGFSAIIYVCLVFAHANQNIIKHENQDAISTQFCPSVWDGIPDQVIGTGKIFQYKIPERAFKMSKNAIIKITPASQNSSLPMWISYDQESRELLAVPTNQDGYGIYLKATLEDPQSNCGKIFDVFHIAVTSWSPSVKKEKQASLESGNTKKSKICYKGVDLIQTTLIFAVNLKELWAVERLNLIKNLAHFLGVNSSLISISTGNELFSTQDNSKSYSILASGHGNTVTIVPNATELTWEVPCNVFPEVHLFVKVLQHNVEGGRLTSEVGHNVVGWYISALVNPSKQQLGRKKRFAQRFMTPMPTPVPDIVPATKFKPTATSKSWWWWPDMKKEDKLTSSSSLEQTSLETLPTDKMTKPFPSQSDTLEHTLIPSSHSLRILPTKISYVTSSSAATTSKTIYSNILSSSLTETTLSYHKESSEFLSSLTSSSRFQTFETLVPEKTYSSTEYDSKSHIDTLSVYSTTPEESRSYTELDSISGSGDSTYIDEDTMPVITTTIPSRIETREPFSLFITPSSPIRKSETEEVLQAATDMPYAGSGSGSGSDEEKTLVTIHPSTHATSDSVFAPTPSLGSVIDSSETNIFYFEETASTSTSKHIDTSIYIPTWDTDLFTTSLSSSNVMWITKDPWSSTDNERTKETMPSEVTESSQGTRSSKDTEPSIDVWFSKKEHSTENWHTKETEPSTGVWYSKKEHSTNIWSSKSTEPSTDVWYSKKEHSTDIWYSKDTDHSTDVWYSKKEHSTNVRYTKETEPSTDVWYSKETEPSTDVWYSKKRQSAETKPSMGLWDSKEGEQTGKPIETKVTDSAKERWWIEETKHTAPTQHTSRPSSVHEEEISSSDSIRTQPTLPPYYATASHISSSSRIQFEKASYSRDSYPSSHSSSDIKQSASIETQEGKILPSTDAYIPTTSGIGMVYIEEETATKYEEIPSRHDSESKMPDKSSSSTKMPDETSSSTKMPDETSSSTKMPDETSSSTKMPDETSSSTKMPDETSSSTKMPDVTSSTKMPDVTSSLTKMPDVTSSSTKMPDETTSSTKMLDETSSSTKMPDVTSSSTKMPDVISSTKMPDEISSSTKMPDETSSSTKMLDETSSSTKMLDKFSPTKVLDKSSSSMPEYKPSMVPEDCSKSGDCSTGSILDASSTWTYEQPTIIYSSIPTESTVITSKIPVTKPRKKQHTTTPQPTTEQRRITKKPKKRPTQPPFTKITDYINKAPKVRAPIGSVYATVGTIFKFQIPKNTFHDPEDGNTRRLTLDVAYRWEPRRPPSNSNSWLEFDEATQTFIGLPLEEEVRQSPMEVTINAIDKGGKLAQDVIKIYINSTAVDLNPAYEFVMKFEVNGKKFLAERKHLRNLMKKLSSFFGDRDPSYITILDARPGSLVLTWTNNSIPTDKCDNETVNEQRKKILDTNNRINPKFRKYMSPRFTVLSTEFNLDGACLGTVTDPGTSDDAETGDVAEVNPWAEAIIPTVIAVAIAIFIVVVILLVCSHKRRQKKNQKNDQRNSFEDQDPVMFHSERSHPDRGMRAKRAVILPGDVNSKSSGHRSFSPYQASGFGEPDNVSDQEEEEEEEEPGRYYYNNGSSNPPPPYRLPPPYYQDNGSSYV